MFAHTVPIRVLGCKPLPKVGVDNKIIRPIFGKKSAEARLSNGSKDYLAPIFLPPEVGFRVISPFPISSEDGKWNIMHVQYLPCDYECSWCPPCFLTLKMCWTARFQGFTFKTRVAGETVRVWCPLLVHLVARDTSTTVEAVIYCQISGPLQSLCRLKE